MSKFKYPRGSEWRKWDLHFHTPSSYDYQDKTVSNERIIEVLREHNISVVAITDHHIIDVERIVKLQELAGDEITILPGIEFCSDSRGEEPIHFIGIFPENIDLEFIKTELLVEYQLYSPPLYQIYSPLFLG
jgi:predicted metal-dependent phosphoesterase TrpH